MHEDNITNGFGAEIVATACEQAGDVLRGRVRRLGAPRSLIAYAPNLEDKIRVSQKMIVKAAVELMEGAPNDIVGSEDVRRVYLGDRFRL